MLDHVDAAPQLPAGYGAMFLAALVPPIWHRLMDPRVADWRQQHYDHRAQALTAAHS